MRQTFVRVSPSYMPMSLLFIPHLSDSYPLPPPSICFFRTTWFRSSNQQHSGAEGAVARPRGALGCRHGDQPGRAPCSDASGRLMYTLHCTKKLLDRVRVSATSTSQAPTTALGNWYATALFWKPQVALILNERTLLPVLMPLAPASTVIRRFPSELAILLAMHGGNQAFIATEVA